MHGYRVGDPELEVVGALSLLRIGERMRPRRLPDEYRAQLPGAFMEAMVDSAAGVRLRFATEATSIAVDLAVHPFLLVGRPAMFAAAVDLVVDGVVERSAAITGAPATLDMLAGTLDIADGDAERVTFEGLAAITKIVEIWLPHTAIVDIVGVETDAPITAAPPSTAPRWVHHGSSISHCMEALGPTRTWPAVAASALGFDLLDLAYAGNAMLDPFVARTIRDQPADLISLKLGINPVNADVMHLRVFASAVHGFLDTIRDGHPDTPIVLISPIVCPVVEDVPGPTIPDPTTGVIYSGALDADAPDALTLTRIRDALQRIVETRSASDPNLRYLDGRELFAVADAEAGHLPDGLHPDDAGYGLMGERFARILPGLGVGLGAGTGAGVGVSVEDSGVAGADS